ncbi:hypothetical protein CPB83DRAFT_246880 [Crepidotus variabilis]|uniref:Uncharacterized protein n=1 Tax=Crepidotus variabilis TaxID=179855 RepID=A0A9P6EIG8_9AGAR|nr:hypothetical protein CPB83DRAFT_246880 [Crepidotus variabilis]
MPLRMIHLASSLQSRFERVGDLADLDSAIEHQQKAVSLTDDHPDIPKLQAMSMTNHLGSLFQDRFQITGDLTDSFNAIKYHQKAIYLLPADHPDSIPSASLSHIYLSTKPALSKQVI